MSSPSSSQSGHAPALASSSRTPPSASPAEDSQSDDGLEIENDELLATEDPLHEHGALEGNLSFKRKPPQQSFASRFLSSPFRGSRNATPSPSRAGNGIRRSATPNTILSYLNSAADPGAGLQDAKDASGLDWYVEGPGRRVGYDNLTAIDWIYEYSKERTRLRQLTTNNPGVLGHVKVVADSSQIWWILVATGLAVGGIAAGIDVASDWLGDLKTGICSNVEDGGKFYLNKAFCCWETNTYAECKDWRPWAKAMGISNKGGSYIIEYFFFVCFSVCVFSPQDGPPANPSQILFATCASLLVNKYSLYAKQSGIPEIKTVLGGFVIRRFLGTWTLVIKSLVVSVSPWHQACG